MFKKPLGDHPNSPPPLVQEGLIWYTMQFMVIYLRDGPLLFIEEGGTFFVKKIVRKL